jgi:hypothetical protein
MSFTPNFSISQSQGSPNLITITDTSLGSDSSQEKAYVYFTKSNGQLLKAKNSNTLYVEIPCDGSGKFITTTIDILDRDYALKVQVDWLDSADDVINTLTQVFLFTQYSENFDYGLVTSMASQPSLVDDKIFLQNKSKVRLLIDSANQAIIYANDLNAAQFCLDEVYNFITNQSFYFPN